MSNDCKECLQMLHNSKKSKSLNQMTEAERDLYWESYKNLVGDSPEGQLDGSQIGDAGMSSTHVTGGEEIVA